MRTTDAKNKIIVGQAYAKEMLAIVKNATHSIYILMFDWRWYGRDMTSDMSLINQAVLQASRRGVTVKVLCNYEEMAAHLRTLGIEAKAWKKQKLMHAKGVLVDDDTLILGSHNWTENAMGLNVEVSSVLYDTDVCEQFKKYFLSLWLL